MSAIKAGDMVMFVRACCSAGNPYLGMVFQVERIQGKFPWVWCHGCNRRHVGKFARFKLHPGPDTAWIPPAWLKKIPPPEELGIVNEREEIIHRDPEVVGIDRTHQAWWRSK
jgi:hypothetical protein